MPEMPIGGVRGFVARHPLPLFVVLSYALSWWTVPVLGGPLGVGPTIAAVMLLALTEGRAGVLGLWSRIVQWRVGWWWFATALLLPALATLTAMAIAVALGADLNLSDAAAKAPEIPINLVVLLLLPLLGPWEEPGFRGFALSTALQRWTPFVSAMVIGVIHIGWHFPLFLSGEVPASDVVLILAASFVFAWLVLGTRGSVLVAMVMHAGSNAFSGEFASTLFAGADGMLYGWAQALLWVAVAACVVTLSPVFRAGSGGMAQSGGRTVVAPTPAD
jgi:membrane protease YdiL (CAAX protease family)